MVISTHSDVFLPCNFYLVLGVRVRTSRPRGPPPPGLAGSRAVVIHPFTPEGSSQARLALLLSLILPCVLTGLLQQFCGST